MIDVGDNLILVATYDVDDRNDYSWAYFKLGSNGFM